MENFQKNKIQYLRSIEAELIKTTSVEETDFLLKNMKHNYFILDPMRGEDVNAFMKRIWKEKEDRNAEKIKKGQKPNCEVVGTYEKLHITTKGAKDVNDMHANALEEEAVRLNNGHNAAIWMGLSVAMHQAAGHTYYVNHLMDKSIGTPTKKDKTIDFDAIEQALTLATIRDEEEFTTGYSEDGYTFVKLDTQKEDFDGYMQRIWDTYQSSGTHAFGVYGKMHITTEGAKTPLDMIDDALQSEKETLYNPKRSTTPIWNGLRIARHLNKGNRFLAEHILGQKIRK